ncbi:MAG: DUF2249 domain-containing protein [Nitriliruptoraceae bacterium]
MLTINLASNPADSQALESIQQHNAALVGGLVAQTASLVTATQGSTDWTSARDTLVGWYRAKLLPHGDAAQSVLYPAARALPTLEPLIRAMSQEHALLGNLVTRLESADEPSVALVQAGAGQTLFETHVAKENDLLLPAMVAAPDISVAALLAEMLESQGVHAAVAKSNSAYDEPGEGPQRHTCGCHEEAAGVPELDARTIPHAIRHATVFGALEAVQPAAKLILVAPHDPLPLLGQIEQRWPLRFAVEYLERGPEDWRLLFARSITGSVDR